MNGTVWYDQIDAGLKNFIQSIVKLKNSEGVLVPVPVRVRKADEDFKQEDYPMVTIYNLSISKRDEVRYYPFRVPRDIDIDKGKVKKAKEQEQNIEKCLDLGSSRLK